MSILVLSSKTGGGHEMRANALLHFGDLLSTKTYIYRPLENGSSFYNFGTNLYNFIQKTYPGAHALYFKFLEKASLHRRSNQILGRDKYLRLVYGLQPKLIISVHAHLNHGYFDLVKHSVRGERTKFLIYCGELADGFGFSRHWVNPDVDAFWGPTKESINAAILRGMPKNKCTVVGPLLRSVFYKDVKNADREAFHKMCNLDKNQTYGVLATGANGANSHLAALKSLKKAGCNLKIIVLCGSSHSLINKVRSLSDRLGLNVRALPTISAKNMRILLTDCDWVFGRPGAGLTSEAISLGTRIYFDVSKGIMPQEHNNLNFLRSNGFPLVLVNRASDLGYKLNLIKEGTGVKLVPNKLKIMDCLGEMLRL